MSGLALITRFIAICLSVLDLQLYWDALLKIKSAFHVFTYEAIEQLLMPRRVSLMS